MKKLFLFLALACAAPSFGAVQTKTALGETPAVGDFFVGYDATQALLGYYTGAEVLAWLNTVYPSKLTALTGGAAGALDSLAVATLADGDIQIVRTISGTTVTVYIYVFDADGTSAESSPTVIRPDDYSTGGVWRLAFAGNQNLLNTADPAFSTLNLTGAGLTVGTGSTTDGKLQIKNATNNNNVFTVQPGATGAALSWTLPIAAPGGTNYLLNADADGTMGYTDPASLGGHDAVTLAASATSILGLSTQEVSFDTQTANYVLAGPTTGAAAAPTFRAMVAADLPAITSALALSWDLSSFTLTLPVPSNLPVPKSASLPGTCAQGDLYQDTDATSRAQLYLCESTNTWAIVGPSLSGYAPLADPVFTGSVALPQGASPTVDAAGEAAVDTTSNQFKYFGSAARVLSPVQFVSVTIPAPSTDDDINLLKAPYGMTITAINCIVQGTTSATGQLQECDSAGANCADLDSDIVCDADGAADDGSLTDSAIASGGWLRWKTTSLSGTPTFLTVTATYLIVGD